MMAPLDTLVRFVIAVLFDGLWEAALLALVAWAALRAMPKANATTRHSVLAVALLAALVLPVATATVTTLHVSSKTSASASTAPETSAGAVRSSRRPIVPAAPLARPPIPIARPNITLPKPLALAIVVAWLAGAAFVLLRLALSLMHLERLKKDSLPVPVEYRAQLVRWSAATKGSRTVRLCRSSEIVIPIAVGLFDAMILIPERFLDELDPSDVDRIVLHELAHLRRADDWLNAVERIATALLFFNPGIAWLAAQLDLEREVACDDWVLQQNEPLPYATCLAKVVETTVWPYRAMSAPGAFLTRRAMSVRIERLLTTHRDVRVRTSFAPAGIVVAALAALGIVAAFVSPSFAYTVSAPSQPQTAPLAVVRPHGVTKTVSRPVVRTVVVDRYISVPQAAPVAVAAPHPPVTHAASPPHATAVTATGTITHTATGTATHTETRTATHTTTNTATNTATNRTSTAMNTATSSASASAASSASASRASSVRVAANSPDYVDELAAAGYANLTIDELTELRALGVTGDYIRQLEDAGIPHPSVHAIVELRALGVQSDYVRAMRPYLGNPIDLNLLSSLKSVGVTPQYVDMLANAGYRNVSGSELVEMRAIGIDQDFMNRVAAHGFHNLSVKDLVRLKTSGIL